MYHAGKKMPAQCDRCKGSNLEKVTINDREFNYVMKIAMSLGKKN